MDKDNEFIENLVEWLRRKVSLLTCFFGFHKWEFDSYIDTEHDYCTSCGVMRKHKI